jgi:hypothetical protein
VERQQHAVGEHRRRRRLVRPQPDPAEGAGPEDPPTPPAPDLAPEELVDGPFAQVIRYEGRKTDADLKSVSFDFYKICLQDHAILETLDQSPALRLFPFSLYIITHELIHIVRFTKFLQRFVATDEERHAEEVRVHDKTHAILTPVSIPGMDAVFRFYAHWRKDFDRLRDPA